MSSPTPPGAAAGDRSIYSGRQLLGHVRSSTAGVLAFDPAGKRIGSFDNEKDARRAIIGRDHPGGA